MLIHLQEDPVFLALVHAPMARKNNSLSSLTSIPEPVEYSLKIAPSKIHFVPRQIKLLVANYVYRADLGLNGPIGNLNSFRYSFASVGSIFGVEGYFWAFVLFYWVGKI